MWLLIACLVVDVCLRILLRGGPALWLALLAGAIVLGGAPHDPLAAALAGLAAFVVCRLVGAEIANRRRGF